MARFFGEWNWSQSRSAAKRRRRSARSVIGVVAIFVSFPLAPCARLAQLRKIEEAAAMTPPTYSTALIVGAGSGLSASLARTFHAAGLGIALAARDVDKLADLCTEFGATAYACDSSDADQVARLVQDLGKGIGAPDVVVYNASHRLR